ncbi:hypothetical protein WA158_004596 [Blastocystis sp. Blastoise]
MNTNYNFKNMTHVPNGTEMVDIVLSRTQRKTPTVIHPGYKIKRIQAFYMRKVKYTQSTCIEKLQLIIDEFPHLDDIHPFYADLINVLYDRDHYKLALGQINTAKGVITQIGQDYVRLLKYGDTLYRCKQLKHAGLGRMCTVLKKLNSSLCYLEEVRKHLSRLPAIDPKSRTLILCGFPNVGKSSFMNTVTRANVDVQPYAFTTKSLFLGHMDYKYLRWQVIDTPGILDHALEERNTIEMQSITALAHLHSSILYFLDISEQCNYTLEDQLSLFRNIRPLFSGKPLFLVCTKTDALRLDQLDPEHRAMVEQAAKDTEATLMHISSLKQEGISDLRNAACEQLLQLRISTKMSSKKAKTVMEMLNVTMPQKRDDVERPAYIPESVKILREQNAQTKTVVNTGRTGRDEQKDMEEERDASGVERRKTQKEIQWEYGGPGVYAMDFAEHYKGMLRNDEWIHDIIPDIMDGHNIADFYDPNIEQKLAELEKEELELSALDGIETEAPLTELDQWILETSKKIRDKKTILQHRAERSGDLNRPKIPLKYRKRTVEELREQLEDVGLETEGITKNIPVKRSYTDESIDRDPEELKKKLSHDQKPASDLAGIRDDATHKKVKAKLHLAQRTFDGKQAESDRFIGTKMPKYLYSGKRGIGKTDRR